MQGAHDNCNGQSNVEEQPMGSVDMAHKIWFSWRPRYMKSQQKYHIICIHDHKRSTDEQKIKDS